MPVSPNNLQFSLSSEYLDKLKSLSKDGESLGLTAKRILIEALDGSIGGEAISKDDDSRLTSLEAAFQLLFEKIMDATKRGLDTEDLLDRLKSRLEKVEDNLNLVFMAAETMEEQEEPDKISQVMEAFKGVTKILSEHNSRLIALESSHQAIKDRIQAVEIGSECQHYGDEVKELRGQVDELRKLVYQLTSPVKRR